MKLTEESLRELRLIFESDFGKDRSDTFSDDDLNHVGIFLLTSLAEATKLRTHAGSLS